MCVVRLEWDDGYRMVQRPCPGSSGPGVERGVKNVAGAAGTARLAWTLSGRTSDTLFGTLPGHSLKRLEPGVREAS